MMGETKKDRIQLLVRRFFLFLTDTFLLNACVYLSLIMRFDVGIVSIEPQYINNYVDNMLFYTIISLLIFWVFRLYHSLWPVSYTHLDVYKRQVHNAVHFDRGAGLRTNMERHTKEIKKAANYMRGKKKKNEFEQIALGAVDTFFREADEAVSYTHLDVYKRQGFPCEAL